MAYTPSFTLRKPNIFLRKYKKSCNFAADYLLTTMKKRFSIFFLAVLSVLFVSCHTSPNSYSEEIEDAVRIQLAIASAMTVYEPGDNAMGLYEWMLFVTNDTIGRQGLYRHLLAEKAKTDAFCAKILHLYDEMEVTLSTLQPTQNKHVWNFKELNTNVRFTFELIPAQNGEVYYRCKGDAKDLRSVMLQSFKIFK